LGKLDKEKNNKKKRKKKKPRSSIILFVELKSITVLNSGLIIKILSQVLQT